MVALEDVTAFLCKVSLIDWLPVSSAGRVVSPHAPQQLEALTRRHGCSVKVDIQHCDKPVEPS
jgi:hypothetical protein